MKKLSQAWSGEDTGARTESRQKQTNEPSVADPPPPIYARNVVKLQKSSNKSECVQRHVISLKQSK